MTPVLKVKRLSERAILPKYQTAGAACFDLHASRPDYVPPLGCAHVNTELAFEVPEGHVMLIFSRSGQGFKQRVRLVNSVGVIDSDYRGEVLVGLQSDDPNQPLNIVIGDRVGQALVIPVQQWDLVEVDELSETVRGTGGYGSTGK